MGRGMESGSPLYATATGSSTCTATLSAVTSKSLYATLVTASSDLAGATVMIKDGTTVIWQDRISNTCPYILMSEAFPLTTTPGNALTVVVTGTSLCNANIAGYVL